MGETFGLVKDVILFALALYGAALSTFNFRQAVRKERRQIAVRFSTAMPTYGSQVGPAFAVLEATNIGQRSVTVHTLVLELEGGARLFPTVLDPFPGIPDTPLPITLGDGETARRYMPYQDIGSALLQLTPDGKAKVTPVCEDSAGGVHRGKAVEFDPAEWSRM